MPPSPFDESPATPDLGSGVRSASFAALVTWLVLCFVASSSSGPHLSDVSWLDLLLKKGAHFTGYGILGAVLIVAIAAWQGRLGWLGTAVAAFGSRARLAVPAALAWAISDEFHQSFTPGRSPAATDVLIDTLGAALGAWLATHVLARVLARRDSARGPRSR